MTRMQRVFTDQNRMEDPATTGRIAPNTAIAWIIAAAAALFCGFITWFPLTDSDIWWHLASGREMVRRGALLFADPFSFTPHDARWINMHWLFQLGAYALHQVAGVKGLLAAKSLLAAGTVGVLVLAVPSLAGRVVAAISVCALMFEARYLVLERPTMVSTLFIAVSLLCWERHRSTGQTRWLWALVPLQFVWTNVQGLSILGPAIAAIFVAGDWAAALLARPTEEGETKSPDVFRRLRDGAMVLVALAASSLLNPYTWRGALFPFRLFERIDPSVKNVFSQNISENAPLMSLLSTNPRYVGVVLGSAALCVFALVASGRRARLSHAILFVCFFYLAFRAERNILLYCLVAAFVLGASAGANRLLQTILQMRPVRVTAGAIALVIAGMVAVPAVRTHANVLAVCPRHSDVSPFRFPEGAVDYLKAHPIKGTIFNADRYGGYILWHCYPPTQVFIDGRFVLRSAGFFSDYLKILDHPSLFPFVMERFGTTHALLQTAIFPRYTPLARALYRDSLWTLVYADGASALFAVRSVAPTPGLRLGDSASVAAIAASLEATWRDDPYLRREALTHLADFLTIMGEAETAGMVSRRIGESFRER